MALNANCISSDLHEKGCPWDEDTCSSAADGGHLRFEIFTRKWLSVGRGHHVKAAESGKLSA